MRDNESSTRPLRPVLTVAAIFLVVVSLCATTATAQHHVGDSIAGSVLSLDTAADAVAVDVLVTVDGQAGLELQHFRSIDAGSSWHGPHRVGLDEHGINRPRRSVDPQVVARGELVVVAWTVEDPQSPFGAGALAIARSEDGGRSWSPPARPFEGQSKGGQSFTDLAVDEDGVLHLVWLDHRDGSQGLRAARSVDAGRSWGPSRTLDQATCECCWNALSTDDAGQLAVLYRDIDPRDMALSVSSDRGLSWEPRGPVGAFEWGIDGCPHAGGGLARTEAGASYLHALVWTGDEERVGIYAMRSADEGEEWSHPLRIGGRTARNLDLTALGNTLYAVWDQRIEGRSAVVWSSSVDHGDSWTEAVQLSGPSARASHPDVVATDGAVVAVWTESQEGTPTRWASKLLNAAGSAPDSP